MTSMQEDKMFTDHGDGVYNSEYLVQRVAENERLNKPVKIFMNSADLKIKFVIAVVLLMATLVVFS